MTSLLPVCLALLLPACVLGQPWLLASKTLAQRCTTPEAKEGFARCDRSFLQRLNITEQQYKTLSKTFICSHIDVWANHTQCVDNGLSVCQPDQSGLSVDAVTMRLAQEYWCMYRNKIRPECLNVQPDYVKCSQSAASLFDTDSANSKDPFRKILCRYLNDVDQCNSDYGKSCPGHDKAIYSTYWRKTYPLECRGFYETNSAYFFLPSSSLFLITFAVLLSKMAFLL